MDAQNPHCILPIKSLADLEWAQVIGALADRCETPIGKEKAEKLGPLDVQDVETSLAEGAEATRLHQRREPIPVAAVADIRNALARLAHGGTLSALEIREVLGVMALARMLRRYLAAHKEDAPMLAVSCDTDPQLDAVEERVARCFDEDGSIADHASPTLKALRQERHACRARMISRLEELMRRYSKSLQDAWWTEREGRYVLPVRSDAHERFPGLVHASSSSGSTLFIEPRVVIPLGNRLKVLEGEVRREEEAVLASLSSRLADILASLHGAVAAVARADFRAATARLAVDIGLEFPELDVREDAFRASLVRLRHPALMIRAIEKQSLSEAKTSVISSDIALESGHAIIISGPNAGGKTVALKALGLAALMVRTGLPIAAHESSTIGFVSAVLTDVGDDQSLQKSLSTFSAHVANLVAILDSAGPGGLVLLDELAGGTDPREGEALAAAVLDSLCRRGACVMCTTHYQGLKVLATCDPRFENASVGFDLDSLRPTFRLSIGVPGASSALIVAQKFGVPSLVIDRAKAFLAGDERNFEQTVATLHQERNALELARAAAENERQQCAQLRVSLEQELERARIRDRKIMEKEAEEVFLSLRKVREQLRQASERLRQKKQEAAEMRETERALQSVAKSFAIGGEFSTLVSPANTDADDRFESIVDETKLKKGLKVFVPKLKAEAEILAVTPEGQLRVTAGSLKLTVSKDQIKLFKPKAAVRILPKIMALAAPEGIPSFEGAQSLPVMQTTENTCDLRGLRADDAAMMLETFLDRALSEGQKYVFVVHGHGSGALRDRVRQDLSQSRYVQKQRPGLFDEGGDGVTVAWLV